MSWRHNKRRITGVRKMRWDHLWHVTYVARSSRGGSMVVETFDRVKKETAMRILTNMRRWERIVEKR